MRAVDSARGACGHRAAGVRRRPIVRLVDITKQAGIAFTHNNGAFGKKYLPETLGAGAAFLDYDNDGRQDMLLVNGANWPGQPQRAAAAALYRNAATAASPTSPRRPASASSCTGWASPSPTSTTTAGRTS